MTNRLSINSEPILNKNTGDSENDYNYTTNNVNKTISITSSENID